LRLEFSPMDYMVLQTDASPPEPELLKSALRAIRHLREPDIIRMAKGAYGILAKGLRSEEAAAVQGVLAAGGLATTIVSAREMALLPDAKYIRRLEFRPDALAIYDPLGRAVPIPWGQVWIVSAGTIRHFKMGETVTENWVSHYNPVTGVSRRLETDVRHHVADNLCGLLEIVLAKRAMRFAIEIEHFLFKFVMDRPNLSAGEKLGTLVSLLAEHAPHVALNRGAAALCAQPPGCVTYSSKAAFAEETTWLAWRLDGAPQAQPPPKQSQG
jgi:hypothetical protein